MASDDYEVGYKKPPKHAQFQPGQSGNPKGRPTGVKNLATDLGEELEQKIVVTEGGKSITTTKQRAMVKTLMAKALSGDVRAIDLLLRRILDFDKLLDPPSGGDLSAEDRAILESFRKQLIQELTATDGESS